MTEQEKHTFLDYKAVIVNFVFSFSWDVVHFSFENIEEKLHLTKGKTWRRIPLHKRPLWWVNENIQASYHPTIVSDNLCAMHTRATIDSNIVVLAPFNKINGIQQKGLQYKEISAALKYDIRIYENGTGTCTFSFKLKKPIDFEEIMLVHHLATSISHLKSSSEDEFELLNQKHLTHSYLKLSEKLKTKYKIRANKIHLTKLFSKLLDSFSELKEVIWDERKLISPNNISANNSSKQDWQNPYVITILQVDKNDLIRTVKQQDRLTTKEIGAIAVRLTQDNSESAEIYFQTLRREYIYKSLGFYINPSEANESGKIRLRNYSHSSNLFYTYGRRAAIAITSDFEMHPSYFAIPTFVNVIELLRARWHLGTIANLKLDETFEKISHRANINSLIDEIFKCRILYGLFLQNPTPYLFDSGAVTEISDSAESVFWLARISKELERKLAAIDRLVEVIYTKKNLENYV